MIYYIYREQGYKSLLPLDKEGIFENVPCIFEIILFNSKFIYCFQNIYFQNYCLKFYLEIQKYY